MFAQILLIFTSTTEASEIDKNKKTVISHICIYILLGYRIHSSYKIIIINENNYLPFDIDYYSIDSSENRINLSTSDN